MKINLIFVIHICIKVYVIIFLSQLSSEPGPGCLGPFCIHWFGMRGWKSMFKLSFQNIVQPDLSVMLSSEFLSIVILFTFGLSRLLLWLKYLLRRTDILYGCHLLLDVCIIYFISCDCIMNSSLSYTIY
jgi:hypothetical protein